jgi:ZIP family zinc transporter
MGEAVLFGVVASSALVIGGAVGAAWQAPRPLTGVLLAFASGALISALCFELFPEAAELGGTPRAGIGLLAGGATFVLANWLLDSRVASAQEQQHEKVRGAAGRSVGLALLAAVTLDGVPENAALGVSLVEDASLALLLAIFASNLPESLVGAMAMREGGLDRRSVIGLWAVAAVLLALAVVLGWAALSSASPETISFFLSFAGGAVLASLADTLMPEAFERGRPLNAFATGVGFYLSFVLAA